MRSISHVPVTLLSRECLHSGIERSILSVSFYVLLIQLILSLLVDISNDTLLVLQWIAKEISTIILISGWTHQLLDYSLDKFCNLIG